MHSPLHTRLILRHASFLAPLLFFFLAVLSMLSPAVAMIDQNVTFHLQPSDTQYNPSTFSFSSSGNFFLSVTLDQPTPIPATNYSIQVLFCSAAAISRLDLTSSLLAYRLFCPDWDLTAAGSQCEYHTLLGVNDHLPPATPIKWTTAESSINVPLSDDDYTIFIMNCGAYTDSNDLHYTGSDLTGQFTFIAQSKPGEYLSLTYIPFKSLYVVSAVLWTLLLLVWSVHCWLWRSFNVRLQLALLAVPVSKMWLGVPYTVFYMLASQSGYTNMTWYWMGRASELIDEVIFFTILILIAKGWCIVTPTLTRQWKKQYVMYIILLIGSSIAYQFGQRTIMITVLVIAYLLLFQYVFTSVMANTLTIVNAVQAFRAFPHIDLSTLPLWSKLHMYKLYQLALVLYASILLITQLWAGLFLTRLPWVSLAVEEVLSVLLGVAVGYGLWMRPFNPYWYWITMLYSQRSEQGGDVGANSNNGGGAAAASRAPHEHDSSERRGRASRRSSSNSNSARGAERGDDHQHDEPAGRRALRQQNNDMRASLLNNDFLDSPRRSPSPSHSDSSSTASSALLLWRPGMPVPPFPADPKQWLVTAEEEDAPLLVVRQPDGSIMLGQYASDVPCKVAIPEEALRYFPDELLDMLYRDDDADEEKDCQQEVGSHDSHWRRRRRDSERDRHHHRHAAAATANSAAEDDRMATSSPAVRRVSSPSQFSFSSRNRVSDHVVHSISNSSRSESESSSWRGGGDEDDGVGSSGGVGHDAALIRGVSMQQLGDEHEEKKQDGGGGGD